MAFQSSASCVRSWMARAAQGRPHGLFQLADHPVAERLERREPGGQPRTGRDLPGMLKQVEVLTAASRITGQQQVGG